MKNKKRKYTITEKAIKAHKDSIKHFDVINQDYYEQFASSDVVSQSSLSQYKSTVRRFSEHVGKDLMTVTVDEINDYINGVDNKKTKEAQEWHIKSFLKFIFVNNIEQAKVSSETDTLLYLVNKDARILLKIIIDRKG